MLKNIKREHTLLTAAPLLKLRVVLLLTCLICGCSIFELKSPEPPFSGEVTEDPLNIGEILSIAHGSSVSMEYAGCFAPDVRFEYSAFRRIEGRDEVVRMLNRLRSQASLVEWHIERANKRFVNGEWIVGGVPYTVYAGRGGATYTGLADFHIVREADWVINYWKDMPDHAPFFEW